MIKTCPCGSSRLFSQCCAPYLLGQRLAETPEALMRSRYSAYATKHVDYIFNTMTGPVLAKKDKTRIKHLAQRVTWTGLTIIDAPMLKPLARKGVVEFIAYFKQNRRADYLCERSQFKKINQRWFYVDSQQPLYAN